MSRRKRKEFKADFKREAVGLTKLGDRTISQVARDLDLTETALLEWVKRAETQAATPAPGAQLELLRESLPEVARDIKLNLSAVLQPGPLADAQRFGVAIASAHSARSGRPSTARRSRSLLVEEQKR